MEGMAGAVDVCYSKCFDRDQNFERGWRAKVAKAFHRLTGWCEEEASIDRTAKEKLWVTGREEVDDREASECMDTRQDDGEGLGRASLFFSFMPAVAYQFVGQLRCIQLQLAQSL